MPEIDNLSISISASAAAAIAELDKLASSLTRFSGASRKVKTSAKEADKGMEDVASSTQKAATNTSTLADKLGKLQSILSGTAPKFKELASAAATIGRVSFSPVTSAFTSLGSAASGAMSSVSGLFSTISRIAFYRLIRTAIKMVTQALSEGIKTLYHYSETFSGTFYQSMNAIATSANYVKNSIAAMVSPLITAVTPVLTSIADKIVDVFNLINQFIARLTGQSTYTAAKKVSTLWDDATKKTAASTQKANNSASKSTKDTAKGISDTVKKTADEIKRYTLGFDELNILGKNKDNGGADSGTGGGSSGGLGDIALPTSSGASSSGTDYGSLFETRKIDGAVSDFADAIRQAFMSQDWQGLGSLIGNKINSALDSVNWSGIGRKVGTALNGVIETAYYLLDTINFTNIGKHIAEFLNNAIEQINFNTLGRLMIKKMTIIPDMIIGFLVEFDWGQAAAKLSDFAIGCFEEITKWFRSHNWVKLGSIIAEKIFDVLTNIDFFGIARSMYYAFNAALDATIGILLGFFTNLGKRIAPSIDWDELKSRIEENIGAIKAVIYGASLVVGAILLFTWAKPALGLGLLAHGAIGMGKSITENFPMIQEKMKGWVKMLTDTIGTASLLLGMLCLGVGYYSVGIGLMVTGALAKGISMTSDYSSVKNWIKGWVDVLVETVSYGLLMLGFLALSTQHYALGIGLLVAGSVGLSKQLSANFSSVVTWISGWVEQFVAAVSKGLLFLGLICLVAQNYMLGVGLIAAGAAGLGLSKSFSATSFINWMRGWLNAIVKVISEASIFLGVIALLSGNIPLGIGLIASGIAGELVTADWEGLRQIGIDAKNKVKEGWDSVKLSLFYNPVDQGQRNFNNQKSAYIPPIEVQIDAVPGQNFKRKVMPLEIDIPAAPKVEVSVGLMKDNWNTVVEWAYQQGNINYDQYVALQKYGWTFIDRWADQFKGSTLFQSISLMKVGWATISAWASNFAGNIINQAVSLTKYGWSSVNNWVEGYSGGTIWQGIGLYVNNWSGFLGTVSRTLHNWFPSIFAEGGAIEHGKVSRFAGGGVIHAYAGGTSSAHGSLFLAGEAGPEIVGHVGGRTEVLNRSQLAATMYSAVNAAMAPAAANFANAAAYMYQGVNGYTEDDMETLIQLVRTGSEATERQNELLRQQNEYLRQINAKEFTTEISTADINRAQARSNRRAGTTIVPMTT